MTGCRRKEHSRQRHWISTLTALAVLLAVAGAGSAGPAVAAGTTQDVQLSFIAPFSGAGMRTDGSSVIWAEEVRDAPPDYGVYPVVAYDFLLENRCWFKNKATGSYDSAETYPLLGPWFAAAGGGVYSQETVNLNDVPPGSVCKVSITRGSTPVKGSSTTYSVG